MQHRLLAPSSHAQWPCAVGRLISRLVAAAAVQILWKFSIYLESVAVLPQIVLLTRTQNIDNLTGNYIFLLGCVAVVVRFVIQYESRVLQVCVRRVQCADLSCAAVSCIVCADRTADCISSTGSTDI